MAVLHSFTVPFSLGTKDFYKKRYWILTLRIDKMPKSYVDPDLLLDKVNLIPGAFMWVQS